LKSVSVNNGQKVTTKQMLGTVAADATTGEPVVQFSLYKGTNPVNPELWLKQD
jgi:septal ring factor EnvC (AmiA/AmiB activator)